MPELINHICLRLRQELSAIIVVLVLAQTNPKERKKQQAYTIPLFEVKGQAHPQNINKMTLLKEKMNKTQFQKKKYKKIGKLMIWPYVSLRLKWVKIKLYYVKAKEILSKKSLGLLNKAV